MFCFKCGKELMDGAMFCAFCGTNVQALYEGSVTPVDDREKSASAAEKDMPNEKNELCDAIESETDEQGAVAEEAVDRDYEDEEESEEEEENEYALAPLERNNIVLYEKATKDDLMKAFEKNNKIVFPLGGMEVPFQRSMYYVALINSCFDSVAEKAVEMIGAFYDNAGSIEAVFNDNNAEAVDILQESAKNSLKFLGLLEIYDYTTTTILKYTGRKSKYRQHGLSVVEIWDEAMGAVYGEYCAINEEADNEKLNREIRKESRDRMQGMGFGLSGAIKAQMKAGAYNMATGAAHSIFNAVGDAMTDSARSSKLKSLYESDVTKNRLMSGMYNAIQQLKFDTIALCGLEELYNRQVIAKVNTVLENISNGAVPESRMDTVVAELLVEDPFNENVYRLCVKRFGDHNYELSLLARLFDMEDCVRRVKNESLINSVINNSAVRNKKAIVELISDEHNVDWVDLIEDESKIGNDTEWLDKLYDNLNLNVDNRYIMSSLRLVEKNVANEEGILAHDNLEEMLYTYYKFSNELDTLEDVATTPIKALDIELIANKYYLTVKRIDTECFAGLQVKELEFGDISLEVLEEGAFRNSTIETIDKLNVKHIPAYAFENCKEIKAIDFLENVESIGEGAFNGCERLQAVVLPRTVISLPENLSDNKDICYECYDRNVESYKLCTKYGWATKISYEAEEFEKGQEYEKQGDGNRAFQAYKTASDRGYVYAYEPLAKCYYNAVGTEQNFEEAFKFFNMADQTVESPMCKHSIGFMHQNGQGTPVDILKAIMYYLEAGKAGVAWSMNAIAMIYFQGLGGYANYIEAAKWFAKAANAGDQTAKNNLEQLLEKNPGFPAVPDNGEADYDIKYLAQHNVAAVARYLFNEFDKTDGSGFYYYGMTEKAVKKFDNAIKEYVPMQRGEIPVVCFDHTIFGSAKDGCVLTDYGVYIHNDGEANQQVPYNQIVDVTKGDKNMILHISDGGIVSVEVGDDDKLTKLEQITRICLSFFSSNL